MNGGVVLAPSSVFNRLTRTQILIDWFLLNERELGLIRHGLSAITDSEAKALLCDLHSHSSSSIAVYKWPSRVAAFLRHVSSTITVDDILRAERDWEGISNVDTDARLSDLTDAEIVRARVWATENDFITHGSSATKYFLNTFKLARAIYPNTLRKQNIGVILPELNFPPFHKHLREKSAVPVRKASELVGKGVLNTYASCLRTLKCLPSDGLDVSPAVADLADGRISIPGSSYAPAGRYKTLPFLVAMTSLRSAVEFYETHSQQIFTAFLELAVDHHRRGDLRIKAFADTQYVATRNGLMFPTTVWAIGGTITANDRKRKSVVQREGSIRSYFHRLRGGEGLYDLICVLWGAIHIIVGTLSARRQGELLDLIAGECLDEAKRRLLFLNRKSGALGIRQAISRPVIDIVIDIVERLEWFQSQLVAAGLLNGPVALFSRPTSSGMAFGTNPGIMNRSIDLFCDFIKSGCDQKGDRFYIRQHQLRRFFVLAFLHGDAYGGLDTLRWFLGHTDPEHLWNYLTEEIPGYSLVSSKASYGSELIAAGAPESDELKQLVDLIAGPSKVHLMTTGDIEDLLEDLIEEGRVEIEPHFFADDSGRTYRVVIRINEPIPS